VNMHAVHDFTVVMSELFIHCLISGGSYKCSVQCLEDAESAGVENAALENAGLENVRIKNMASVE